MSDLEAKKAKRREYMRIWRIKNPDKIRKAERKKYLKSGEKIRARAKQWRAANRERHLANTERSQAANPEQVRTNKTRWRLKEYGLTQDAFTAMLREQGNSCAVCRQEFTAARRPNVDHDHKTDEVRGVLCRACNHGLGNFRDDPQFLLRAIRYLRGNNLVLFAGLTREEALARAPEKVSKALAEGELAVSAWTGLIEVFKGQPDGDLYP